MRIKKLIKVLAVNCLCIVCVGHNTAFAAVSPPMSEYTAISPLTGQEEADKSLRSMATANSYDNIAISQVSNFVNVREEPNTTSQILGKIYNHCAATILSTVEGEGGTWYQMQSGSVNGYIKAEYFITGAEAEAVARQIGNEYATVINTSSLQLREKPDLQSNMLTQLAEGARYVVAEESGDFVKLVIDEDLTGYVSKEYVKIEVEFNQAVSLSEEQSNITEEEKRKKEAQEAMGYLEQLKKQNPDIQLVEPLKLENGDSQPVSTGPVAPSGPSGSSSPESVQMGSAARDAIVAYARQFLGNPYVYGGTSLTDGADCSGFTQSLFAHFGITLGRSSRDQALNGTTINWEDARPGDLLFYSSGDYINHVALYIGGGQIIHSSTPQTGITIAPANYRTPTTAVSILN